jgi:hypothetical protein
MKEKLALITIFLIFVLLSYLVQRVLLSVKLFLCLLLSLCYLFLTVLLFVGMDALNKYLKIDFGFADESLIETFTLCALLGIGNLIWIGFRRKKQVG